MTTVNAVRARLVEMWESFWHLRVQEDVRWRASAGEPPIEAPAPTAESAACARPDRPRPLTELVAERLQETQQTQATRQAQEMPVAIQPPAPLDNNTAPDLTALIAQRQDEHRMSHGEPTRAKD
ncbi:MAG: hypothetical protein WD873_01595 [Candidatus Hydrogenedentales bacterium]